MRITDFEILTVAVPMRMTVKHALAERRTATNVLVRVTGDDGQVGWGESCPRPYVTGETVDSVVTLLSERILPALRGCVFDAFDDTVTALSAELDGLARNEQAAFCAAELAVLDLAGKAFGVSAGTAIGPLLTDHVRYSGVIATADLDEVREAAAFVRKFGAAAVKVKVVADLDTNLRILEIARATLGDDVELRVDANCVWSGEEAVRQLEALADYHLAGVEQPVAAADLAGLRTVTAAGIVPVVADESLCSLDDADTLIRERACDVLNIRISKCGGLINAGRLHDRAIDAGLACQLGAQVGETGILSAAGRHYATRCAPVRWLEGSYGSLLLETDLVEPDVTIGPGGHAPALDGPGHGVVLIEDRLARYRLDVARPG